MTRSPTVLAADGGPSAIGSVLRSVAWFMSLGIAVVMVLGELGIDPAPIVAGAGVVGFGPPARSRRGRASGGGQAVLSRYGVGLRVGDRSQRYAQVVIDMPVAHDTDLERARTVVQDVADALHTEEERTDVLLAEPEFLGVEQITTEGVFLRLTVRTTDADQRRVGRELRMRLEERFVAGGFRTPLPSIGSSSGSGTGSR